MKTFEKFLLGMIIGITFIMVIFAFTSCSRSITPWQAANGKAKCGRWLK